MKASTLFEAINDIDEKIIEEAEITQLKSKSKGSALRKMLLPAVACIAILVTILYRQTNTYVDPITPPNTTKLPLLAVDEDEFYAGGMGFEGYMAFTMDDLKNSNPWNEGINLSTLPVFSNSYSYDENGNVPEPNLEGMREQAIYMASLLEIEESNMEITDNYPTPETIEQVTEKYADIGENVPSEFFSVSEVSVKSENIEITVNSELETTIYFDPAVSLPDNYKFTHHASYEDTKAAAEYLVVQYRSLVQMDIPKANIYGAFYVPAVEEQYIENMSIWNGSFNN